MTVNEEGKTPFVEMDPDEVRKLLEGHDDVLTPMIDKDRLYYQAHPCPRCRGSSVEAFTNPRTPFSPGNPLPNKLLRCRDCGVEFEPRSGLIVRVPLTPEST
jgi:hypothetical protein